MNRYLNLSIGLFMILMLVLFILFKGNKSSELSETLKERSPHHKHEYNDFFFSIRNYPHKSPDLEAYLTQINAIKKAKNKTLHKQADDWRLEGPKNLGGRINTLAIHPSNPNIMYAGAAKGGIFKTINGGLNWQPIFDEQNLISISKIVFDPNNPNILYAGTGDVNISAFPSVGDGLYKSTNAGLTWENIGLGQARIISDIYVNPKNPDEIYASAMGLPYERNTHRGLYKTTDGGKKWDHILFVSNEVGIVDIAVHPTNANIVYAVGWNRIRNNKESTTGGSGAKVFKTTNGGISWKSLKGGLPQDDFSRMGIAMSPINPNKLYVTYINLMHGYHSTYKTINGGEKWTKFEDNDKQKATFGGAGKDFGWYFGKIRVDPKNDDILYILGVDLWKVSDNGKKWDLLINDVLYDVHPDFHDLQFVNANTAIAATDGGIYRGDKNFSGVWTWKDIDDIPNSQFYRVAVNPHKNETYAGGLQDNGSSQGNYFNINNWTRLWGGDGFTVQYHPSDASRIFVTTQHGYLYFIQDYGDEFNDSTADFTWKSFNKGVDTEDRSNWDTPFLISKHDNKVLYRGTYRMYKTASDTIANWKPISGDLTDGLILHKRFHTITTIDESPINPSVLMAGTVDANVWITKDGGRNWNDIKYGLPERYITSVKASPKDDKTVYVTQSGYKDNDNQPYIFKSTNFGYCWMSINGNLPAVALNDIAIYDNGIDNILFVATDGGVFYSNNGGYLWTIMGTQMPLVPVYDIEIDYKANRLIAGTFARSMYSYSLEKIVSNSATIVNQFDTIPPALSVSGPKEIIILPGEPFNYPYASASDNMDCDLTNAIKIDSNVNVDKTGIYFVTYSVSDSSDNTTEQTIQVTVTGDSPPQLYINSANSISFWEGTTFYIPHATAQDDMDGDLTDAIKYTHDININLPGTYSITYKVTDSRGNSTIETIEVYIVKDEPPVLTIDGKSLITIDQFTQFELPSITAYDEVDGDLTYKIETLNDNINVTVPGTYRIKVMVQDSFGNVTTEDIVVIVNMVTAMNESVKDAFIQINPNPAKDVVYFITKNNQQISECLIFDANGQLLLKERFEPQLDISHLKNGTYFCVFKTSKNTYITLPLIKQ